MLYLLQDDKILALSKLKAFADDNGCIQLGIPV